MAPVASIRPEDSVLEGGLSSSTEESKDEGGRGFREGDSEDWEADSIFFYLLWNSYSRYNIKNTVAYITKKYNEKHKKEMVG